MKIFLTALIIFSTIAHAKLSVVATTTDLKTLVNEVGKDFVSAESIAKGTQDPHFVEAKPSFMTKASRADLLVAVGLDLEIGWLPSIVRGARNPKIMPGNKGYLELGPLIQPIELPTGAVTRAAGDVHPLGNPHFWLDPIRMGEAASYLAQRLGELDPPNAAHYLENAKALQNRFADKTKIWTARIEKTGVKKVIAYHKTLNYFFDRFHIDNPATLEPKPGIPPTSGHILEVIKIIKEQNIPLILVENFYDPTVTKRIEQEVPSIRTKTVPVSVDGAPEIKTLDDLYEKLVSSVEGK